MDITLSTDGGGDKPVTADELDELLKGLTTFGDMDYGSVETAISYSNNYFVIRVDSGTAPCRSP
jgi:hypothetical protein